MAFGLELVMYSTGTEITNNNKKNGDKIPRKIKKEIGAGQIFFNKVVA